MIFFMVIALKLSKKCLYFMQFYTLPNPGVALAAALTERFFFSFAAWLLFAVGIYSQRTEGNREDPVLKVEKDDPHNAPESGDKKPQPVKK
jgi:hypothetical protein